MGPIEERENVNWREDERISKGIFQRKKGKKRREIRVSRKEDLVQKRVGPIEEIFSPKREGETWLRGSGTH